MCALVFGCHRVQDVKPRNVVRVGMRWQLIDLDAAVPFGEEVGHKWSSGFAAPELAERKCQHKLLENAQPSIDMW